MEGKLALDLQMFAGDDFDFDEFSRRFEESFNADDDDDVTEPEGEGEGEEVTEPEGEVTDDDDDVTEPEGEGEEEKPEPVAQSPQANAKFAEMRRQLEEQSKYVSFIQKLADQNGMTPEQVLEAYEQRMMEEKAKAQNVPVEVLQKIQALEQENQNNKIAAQRERFNSQVNSTKEKYNLTDEDIRDTIANAQKDGLDVLNMPFEKVYQIVNFDKIMEQRIESVRQKELEEKKKRQTTSPIPNSTSAETYDSDDELNEEVMKFLKSEGVID